MASRCSIYLTLIVGVLALFLHSARAEVSTVEGSTHFVLHHTLIPLDVLPGQGPQSSQPYWSLNVTSDGIDYEIGQQFDLGDASQPSSIDLGGVSIPADSIVSLQGDVTYTADHYAYLQNVDHVVLVRKDYQVILPTREPIEDAFSDWRCSGVTAAQAEIFAHVWYQPASDALSGSYVVDLSGEDFRDAANPVQIALVENTRAKQERGAVLFEGENNEAKVSISIHAASAHPASLGAQLPGLVQFELKDESSDPSSLKMDEVRVSCVRDR